MEYAVGIVLIFQAILIVYAMYEIWTHKDEELDEKDFLRIRFKEDDNED